MTPGSFPCFREKDQASLKEMRASKSKRMRKKRAKERNRTADEARQEGYRRAGETAHLRPTNMRRLLGIGSRGVDLKIHFDYDVEIPYDQDDPVGSVERARELGTDWAKADYPTAGDA